MSGGTAVGAMGVGSKGMNHNHNSNSTGSGSASSSSAAAAAAAGAAAAGPHRPGSGQGRVSAAAAVASAAVLNPQEQARTRAREKATQALLDSFRERDATVVPSAKWRRQYINVAGIGPAAAAAIADVITAGDGEGRLVEGGKRRPTPGRRPRGGATTSGGGGQTPVATFVTLDLRALKIGDEGAAVLAGALAGDGLVENVILSGNQITDAGAKKFVEAFATNKVGAAQRPSPSAITLLVLSDNPISSSGVTTLAAGLGGLTRLQRLELGRGRVGEGSEDEADHLSEEAAGALVRLIRSAPALTTLVFKGTGNALLTDFSPAALTAFVREVVPGGRLTALFLQECFTTKPILTPASPITTTATNGGSPSRPTSAEAANGAPCALVDQGSSDPSLLRAYLTPMIALAKALTQPTTRLTTLVLRFPLCDAAVEILSTGIAGAILLSSLSLRGCDMSAAGLRTLAAALVENRTVSALDISYQSNLIAHPTVLAETRSSSRRRFSFPADHRDGSVQMSLSSTGTFSGASGDPIPTRAERDHPLLPIIKALHTNRTLAQLIMLGVNISTDDIEEMCSCVEQSGNHVVSEVAFTTTGADALNMKLENFLAANREYGMGNNNSTATPALPKVSNLRGAGGSSNTLFHDTITERSQQSESATLHSSNEKNRPKSPAQNKNSSNRGVCYMNSSIPVTPGPQPSNIPHLPPGGGGGSGESFGDDPFARGRRSPTTHDMPLYPVNRGGRATPGTSLISLQSGLGSGGGGGGDGPLQQQQYAGARQSPGSSLASMQFTRHTTTAGTVNTSTAGGSGGGATPMRVGDITLEVGNNVSNKAKAAAGEHMLESDADMTASDLSRTRAARAPDGAGSKEK